MICPPTLRRSLAVALLGLATLIAAVAQTDQKFTTSKVLETEARTFVQLLQRYHYNRDAVTSADYAEVVPDYMAELDPQHLFFLNSDKVSFAEKYAKTSITTPPSSATSTPPTKSTTSTTRASKAASTGSSTN